MVVWALNQSGVIVSCFGNGVWMRNCRPECRNSCTYGPGHPVVCLRAFLCRIDKRLSFLWGIRSQDELLTGGNPFLLRWAWWWHSYFTCVIRMFWFFILPSRTKSVWRGSPFHSFNLLLVGMGKPFDNFIGAVFVIQIGLPIKTVLLSPVVDKGVVPFPSRPITSPIDGRYALLL